MADKSQIEWTDATWNPTVGCSIVSPGCTNCYAMNVAAGLERRGRGRFHMRPYPDVPGRSSEHQIMVPLGKKAAGRLLDGKTHDAFPMARGLRKP